MADQTVLALLQEISQKLTALQQQVAALSAAQSSTAGAVAVKVEQTKALVSDTQIAVLHVQNTLGNNGG